MSDAMSRSEEMYVCWAPDEGVWTPWAKPVLFSIPLMTSREEFLFADDEELAGSLSFLENFSFNDASAVVVDLPSVKSVWAAMALAEKGYRPVPLYNGCDGPGAVVPLDKLVRAVVKATEKLQVKPPALNAPPAFLLDSRRMSGYASPRSFDNRWMTFAQDFPSANFLLSRGVRQVILISEPDGMAQDDLAHVLLRWREAGLEVRAFHLLSHDMRELVIRKPSKYKMFFYRALARMGLRPNSAGGFGDVVPVPSETSYGGYG